MSKVTWDKMTPDEQALVKKFAREAQLEQRALWDKSVAEYSAKLKAAGIEWIEVDKKPFFDATAPVRAKYGAQYADLIAAHRRRPVAPLPRRAAAAMPEPRAAYRPTAMPPSSRTRSTTSTGCASGPRAPPSC